MGKGGGIGGMMARRGFRKQKMKQLKELKSGGGTLPVDIPGFSGGDARTGKTKKRKKKKRR
jgi:hypothetical protein